MQKKNGDPVEGRIMEVIQLNIQTEVKRKVKALIDTMDNIMYANLQRIPE